MANAKILVSVNGGANTSGGIDVPSEATIALSGQSTVGWLRQRWEIVDYPEGFTAPAGWLTDANGTIYSLDVVPPAFTLPTAASRWGTYALRLKVNAQLDTDEKLEGLLDESTMLSMLSPNGLRDMAAREGLQFCTPTTLHKRWVRSYQRNLRALDALMVGGGEVNTTSNLPGGVGVAAPKDGANLPFYPLAGLGGISVTLVDGVIRIDGTDVAGGDGSTVLNGTDAPGSGVGEDGDFYIRTSDWTIYGPKTAGAWGSPTSLVGPQGDQGIQGIQGEQGEQGPQGIQGPPGEGGSVTPGTQNQVYRTTHAGAVWGPDDRAAVVVSGSTLNNVVAEDNDGNHAGVVILTNGSTPTLTGLAGGYSGRRVFVHAGAAFSIAHLDNDSSEGNRINLGPWATSVSVALGETVELVWREPLSSEDHGVWFPAAINKQAGSSGEANTASSLGGTASLVGTKSGVDLRFRGLSATSPVAVTQNANDVTLALTGGTNGMFLTWASGVPSWGYGAARIDLGTSPGSGALINLPSTSAAVMKAAGGVIIAHDANTVYFGGDSAYANQWANIRIYAGTFVGIGIASSNAIEILSGSTTVKANSASPDAGHVYTAYEIGVGLPRVGKATPYASEGVANTITGGSRALSSSEYGRKVLPFNAGEGATFGIPPASQIGSYEKTIIQLGTPFALNDGTREIDIPGSGTSGGGTLIVTNTFIKYIYGTVVTGS